MQSVQVESRRNDFANGRDSSGQRWRAGFGSDLNSWRIRKGCWTEMTISPCSQSGEVGNYSMCTDTRGHSPESIVTRLLTVPPRKTSDCELLQMTRDAFGAVKNRSSSTSVTFVCTVTKFFFIEIENAILYKEIYSFRNLLWEILKPSFCRQKATLSSKKNCWLQYCVMNLGYSLKFRRWELDWIYF